MNGTSLLRLMHHRLATFSFQSSAPDSPTYRPIRPLPEPFQPRDNVQIGIQIIRRFAEFPGISDCLTLRVLRFSHNGHCLFRSSRLYDISSRQACFWIYDGAVFRRGVGLTSRSASLKVDYASCVHST
jgi:hypothetical protein